MPNSFIDSGKSLSNEEIVFRLTEVLKKYDLKDWKVILKKI